MEKLIFVAIVVVATLLHSWYQRRREEAANDGSEAGRSRTPSDPPNRPTPAANWEEQLRRLLQGDEPMAPPPRPVNRPPQPEYRPAMPAPPPLPPSRPGSRPVPPAPGAPRPVLARTAIPIPDQGREMETGLPVAPVILRQASSAHERAAHVQASVVQRMQEASTLVTGHASAGPRRATHSKPMRELLRSREAQRSAILATVILGPPRALEN